MHFRRSIMESIGVPFFEKNGTPIRIGLETRPKITTLSKIPHDIFN